MPEQIGVPTAKSMTNAFGSYAIGVGGRLVYDFARAFFGTGIIGSLAGPIAAGSVLKGANGQIIALVSGFEAGSELLGGLLGGGGNRSSGRGVM